MRKPTKMSNAPILAICFCTSNTYNRFHGNGKINHFSSKIYMYLQLIVMMIKIVKENSFYFLSNKLSNKITSSAPLQHINLNLLFLSRNVKQKMRCFGVCENILVCFSCSILRENSIHVRFYYILYDFLIVSFMF